MQPGLRRSCRYVEQRGGRLLGQSFEVAQYQYRAMLR
jgi:hypothetical protein